MQYTTLQYSKLKNKIIQKIGCEFDNAIYNDEVDDFLDKYGITFEEEAMPVNPRTMKILVFGQLEGKRKDYILTAKKLGISEEHLEFVDTYEDTKKYNIAKLEYTFEYSDIILGPMPHKIKGIEDDSSFIAKIRNEPNKYPRANVCKSSGTLKLSITSFKNALLNTRYFEALS